MPTELGLLTVHVVDTGLDLPSRTSDVYVVVLHDDVEYRTPLARRRDGRLAWDTGVTLNLAEGSPAVARVELRAPGLVRASVVAAGEVSVERAVSSGFDGVTVALTSKSGACRGHVRVELCFMLGENARGDAFESGALVNGPTEGDDPESATTSDASEPTHRSEGGWSPSSSSAGGPLSQGASRLPGGPGGPAVTLPAYGLHGPSRLGRTASIQLPPPLAAALAATTAATAEIDAAPPPAAPAPGAPFSLAHARSATEAALARTFSSRGAGAALLGAARPDLPPGGLARCVSDAAAVGGAPADGAAAAAAAAAAAEYEVAGDDWDLAALSAVAANDDGRSVRAGLMAAPPACCSYAALHGASVGDCGCGGKEGEGAPTVALTVDAAPRSRAPPPHGAPASTSQGPLAALEDIHDIVRDYVDACAEFELRPAAAAFAPPRDMRRSRRRAETGGGSDFATPDTPASDGALSIDSDGGAWGSPTARSTTPSIDSEPYHMAFTGLTLADAPKPPHGLAPLRTSRRRRGRRGTLDGGGDVGESSDDAAVSVSPAW